MLNLNRKIGETIIIDDEVRVTVLGIYRDGTVRIGTDAPKSVPVYREEIYKRIQNERN